MSTSDLITKLEHLRAESNWVDRALQSRAYTDSKILLPSLNWEDLISDQVTETTPKPSASLRDLQITTTIIANDEKIVHAIKDLIATIDKYRRHQRTTTEILLSRNAKIQELEQRVRDLEKQNDRMDVRNRDEKNDQVAMVKENQRLVHLNKIQARKLQSMVSWAQDLKAQHRVDCKRRDLEIGRLKNKLVEKRQLSSTVEFGIPLSLNSAQERNNIADDVGGVDDDGQVEGIFLGSGGGGDTAVAKVASGPSLAQIQRVIAKENASFTSSLMRIVESIASENYKLCKFIHCVKDYITVTSAELSNLRSSGSATLPNPSDLIDLDEINRDDDAAMQNYYNEMENSEAIERPLLNELYKIYHIFEDIVEALNNPGFTQNYNEVIEKLQNDMKQMEKNWKDALSTSEVWKKLAKQKQQKDK
ncbi:uncharacterized protein LODBEIA_P25380 [Lodderomyces beijingensis]|uniref:Autophagy-related protein 25 n=1 Tax=Lodderomyces beijingensis TaxID=1775926 RepID=A0ABP0ZKB3_9ASCO